MSEKLIWRWKTTAVTQIFKEMLWPLSLTETFYTGLVLKWHVFPLCSISGMSIFRKFTEFHKFNLLRVSSVNLTFQPQLSFQVLLMFLYAVVLIEGWGCFPKSSVNFVIRELASLLYTLMKVQQAFTICQTDKKINLQICKIKWSAANSDWALMGLSVVFTPYMCSNLTK